VGGLAHALRGAARDLGEGNGSGAVLAERAADGMERVAESLQKRDLDGVIAEVQEFARRSPALFVGGAVTAGFVLARFLKSSQEHHAAAGRAPEMAANPGGSTATGAFASERTV